MRKLAIIALVLGATAGAQADLTPIFQETFNSENNGHGVTNYAGFANWNVIEGSVDLIGNGYFQLLPASWGLGLFIDMDGSTRNAGTIETKQTFVFGPGRYALSFDVAGSQRAGTQFSPTDTVSFSVALGTLLNDSVTLSNFATPTLQHKTYLFDVNTATAGTLRFSGLGGDNVGLLLDNVSLVALPAPGAALLVMLGLSIVGWVKKWSE